MRSLFHRVRLKTVRAKLTMLVALSALVMLFTLPVLSMVLRRQLVDEVDDRVVEAEKSFRVELLDDQADLLLAARVLARSTDAYHALVQKDAKAAQELTGIFLSVYPNVDIILADMSGRVLVQAGCASPPAHIRELGDLTDALRGKEYRGVLEHGCERRGTLAPPAFVIGLPVREAGTVFVCLPLDREFIENASVKLGLELALVRTGTTGPIVATPNFPVDGIPLERVQAPLHEGAKTSWAVARFGVRELTTPVGKIDIVIALDVGDVRALVYRNLLFTLGVLLLAALVSILAGARLARIMSDAISRVNVALAKLAQQEYVHVETLRTGDELEDLATGFNTMIDGLKERDKLRSTLGKYMTASVLEHLLAGKVELGGRTLPVTILFTDIRSFTTISEKMDAHELVALLNEYFTEMVSIVMEEEGVVDKYIGDAIMAVFGAPVPRPDDALHAVCAAVRMRVALRHLNVRLIARGIAPLKTGIGLHTGDVVAGNIGSERRMEYTVIGDPVNLASRMEKATKELGVPVLISETTYQLTKHKIVARPVQEIAVRGRMAPIRTYEVLGIQGGVMIEEPAEEILEQASSPAA